MEFVIFVSFLDILLENVLHKDPFILNLLDLPMGEEEEAEVLIITSQEHLSLQEEGGAEEGEDNDMKEKLRTWWKKMSFVWEYSWLCVLQITLL